MSPTGKRGSRRISVFDTTLRDGEQAPGNAMSPQTKLELALAIEALGVDVIEVGFPNSSPSDFTALQLVSRALTTARFCSLARANRADIEAAVAGGGTDRHQVEIMVTGSELHMEHKRGITRAENLAECEFAIGLARSLGVRDISLGLEDASRGSDDLLRALIETGLAEGATTVVLADTTGHMVPGEFGEMTAKVRSWISDDVVLSVHCHDDMGLSLANALAAVEAGADEVQATVAGIGERAGNTPLEELAAVLTYKGHLYDAHTTVETAGLHDVFQTLSRKIGLAPPRNKAIFGDNVFSTLAGIHQAGMLRNPITYEYVEPERFGQERKILVGRHSGRAVLRHVFDELGLPWDAELGQKVYEEHIASRSDGDYISVAELEQVLSTTVAAAI
ncbi:LeuA family protein [Lentzea sp. NPDC059081]|uniref:LeuA family protein n=1 Tax=Lentzea sp. NPDC059081 TaxID=3346719 RepID=UPI0036784EA8